MWYECVHYKLHSTSSCCYNRHINPLLWSHVIVKNLPGSRLVGHPGTWPTVFRFSAASEITSFPII